MEQDNFKAMLQRCPNIETTYVRMRFRTDVRPVAVVAVVAVAAEPVDDVLADRFILTHLRSRQ